MARITGTKRGASLYTVLDTGFWNTGCWNTTS